MKTFKTIAFWTILVLSGFTDGVVLFTVFRPSPRACCNQCKCGSVCHCHDVEPWCPCGLHCNCKDCPGK